MSAPVDKPVSDLQPGDNVGPGWYVVLDTFRTADGCAAATVRFPDGGTGERLWDDDQHLVPVVEGKP